MVPTSNCNKLQEHTSVENISIRIILPPDKYEPRPFNVPSLLLGSYNGLVVFRVEGNTDHRCSPFLNGEV